MNILKAAADLFSERGFAAVGVDEIGERAGVTGPAIYRHFRGKDELLATLCDNALDQLLILTGGEFEDPWDEVAHLVDAHAGFMLSHRALAGVWIREGRLVSDRFRTRVYRRQRGYIQRWTDCVHRCLPGRLDDELATVVFAALGSLNSMATWPPAALRGDPAELMKAAVVGWMRTLESDAVQMSSAPPEEASPE